jgi:hypothetical protein
MPFYFWLEQGDAPRHQLRNLGAVLRRCSGFFWLCAVSSYVPQGTSSRRPPRRQPTRYGYDETSTQARRPTNLAVAQKSILRHAVGWHRSDRFYAADSRDGPTKRKRSGPNEVENRPLLESPAQVWAATGRRARLARRGAHQSNSYAGGTHLPHATALNSVIGL